MLFTCLRWKIRNYLVVSGYVTYGIPTASTWMPRVEVYPSSYLFCPDPVSRTPLTQRGELAWQDSVKPPRVLAPLDLPQERLPRRGFRDVRERPPAHREKKVETEAPPV